MIVPPAASMLDKLPIVSVPAPTVSTPDDSVSNLVTVTFAAVAIVAPNDVSLRVTIGPVNVKPEVRPSTILSAEITPVPANAPDVIESVVPGKAASVPATVNEDVPEKTSLLVIVTTTPAGMITLSVDNNIPGAIPPHVRPALKLPDSTAVYVVAFAALPPKAIQSTMIHVFLKALVKFPIFCCNGAYFMLTQYQVTTMPMPLIW